VFDLTDLNLDGVETVDDDQTLSSVRTIAGLHLRNAKAGTRSCSYCVPWPPYCIPLCYPSHPAPSDER
jgi:hypothetical protein